MILPSSNLKTHLQQKGLAKCFLVYGQELLLADEAVIELNKFAKEKGFLERDVFYLKTNFKLAKIMDSIRNRSLFSPKKVIEIRLEQEKVNKKDSEKISEIVNSNKSNLIIIYATKLSYKSQKDKWFTKIVSENIAINCPKIFLNQLPTWIVQRAKDNDLELDSSAIKKIVAFSEGNLFWSVQIIQQLKYLNTNAESIITGETIDSILVDNSIFQINDLVSAIFAKKKRSKRILAKLKAENLSSVFIASALTREINVFLEIYYCGSNINQAFSDLKIWQSRQALYRNAINLFDIKQFKHAQKQLSNIDKINKGVKKGDVWLELDRFIFDLIFK